MANNLRGNWDEYSRLAPQDKWRAFPTATAREFFGRWIKLYERLVWMVAPTVDESHGDGGEYFTRAGNSEEEDRLLALDVDDESVIFDDEETAVSFL